MRPRVRRLHLRATWSSRSSLSGLPTSWTPVGRPSAPKPDRERDRRLAGDVEQRRVGREAAGARRGRRSGSSPSPLHSPIVSGRSASAGRHQQVVVGEERDEAARDRLHLGDRAEVGDRRRLPAPARRSRARAARSRPRPARGPRARTPASIPSAIAGPKTLMKIAQRLRRRRTRARPRPPRGRARRAARRRRAGRGSPRRRRRASNGLSAVTATRSLPGIAPHRGRVGLERAAAPSSRRRPRSRRARRARCAVSATVRVSTPLAGQPRLAEVRPDGHPPAARLEAHEAAARRRGCGSTRRRRCRARAGPSRPRPPRPQPPLDPPGVRVEVPRVAGRAGVARLGGRQDRELRQVRDADDHEARLAQPADEVGGVVGPVAGQELRAAVDLVALDADVALDRDRHARERRARRPATTASAAASARSPSTSMNALMRRIERLDAPQRGLDDLARARVAGAHQRGGLFGRGEREIVHEARHPSD